jgi:hypothetical protein
MRKVGFALTALIAAELVAFLAWYSLQHRSPSLMSFGNPLADYVAGLKPSMRAYGYLIGHGDHLAPSSAKGFG